VQKEDNNFLATCRLPLLPTALNFREWQRFNFNHDTSRKAIKILPLLAMKKYVDVQPVPTDDLSFSYFVAKAKNNQAFCLLLSSKDRPRPPPKFPPLDNLGSKP